MRDHKPKYLKHALFIQYTNLSLILYLVCIQWTLFMLVFYKTLHCNGPPWDPKVYKRTTKSDKKVRSWQKLINFTELTGLWGHLYSVHTQVKSENHERNQLVRSMPCHLNKIHPCVHATTGSWYCWWHNFKNSLAIAPSFSDNCVTTTWWFFLTGPPQNISKYRKVYLG